MANSVTDVVSSAEAATRPSLVEDFKIEGLYGYRTISLQSNYAATILIAKNGSGKTTLLGALDAFLRGQFTRLATLHFTSIQCKLCGVSDPLVVEKADVDRLVNLTVESPVWVTAKSWEVEPFALLDFLLLDLDERTYYQDNDVFEQIYRKVGYSPPALKKQCDQLAATVLAQNPKIAALRNTLKKELQGIDIVYLPTYRRIELSLPEPSDSKHLRRRPSIQSRLGISRLGLHAGNIQFGLADISERLSALNQQMIIQSNQGYGEVSANIINDLISGAFERESPSLEERPTKEALTLFFSRVRDSRSMMNYGPYREAAIPEIDRIYSGEDISEESNKFLTYFLGKLNSVIQETRDVEFLVEEFIRNCNRYLSNESGEPLNGATTSGSASAADDKLLTLDRRNLRVRVKSKGTKRKISLDALSSGEKQMISLFARLYLYPKDKLVLVDEPELSLSLDWQRKILPDIVKAPTCKQMIAITHSPFVFDNELEPFATSMRLEILTPSELSLFPDDDLSDDAHDE